MRQRAVDATPQLAGTAPGSLERAMIVVRVGS